MKYFNLVKIFNLGKIERQIIYLTAFIVFFIVNVFFSSISLRYDASAGKAYTLSSSTNNVLKKLDDIVNIKFFASSNLPTKLIPLKTDVTDFLNEYKKNSNGKIVLKILDPKKDSKALQDVKNAGIPEIQFSQLENDKYQVSASYFGIVISYGDKKEVLPQVTNIESLEYNLTAAIYKLTRKDQVKIGIIGYDESGTIRKILKQQFEIQNLDISSKSAITNIDSSVKTILVFDNGSKQFDEGEINKLKQYIDNKGKVVFFTDGIRVSENLTTAPTNHNLFTFLSDYGLEINKNLVLSTSAELVNFGGDQFSLLVPYPFWLKASNFSNKVSYFSNLQQLTFPWVSSIDLKKVDNYETEALIKTSKRSWEQKDNGQGTGIILNPQNIPQPQNSDLKEFVISARSISKNGGQIVLISSSRFVLDKFLGRTSDNLEFVLNLVNDFASSGALSGIRQRAVLFYPLPDLAENQKDIFKYFNTLLLPALFTIFGVWKLLKRR